MCVLFRIKLWRIINILLPLTALTTSIPCMMVSVFKERPVGCWLKFSNAELDKINLNLLSKHALWIMFDGIRSIPAWEIVIEPLNIKRRWALIDWLNIRIHVIWKRLPNKMLMDAWIPTNRINKNNSIRHNIYRWKVTSPRII